MTDDPYQPLVTLAADDNGNTLDNALRSPPFLSYLIISVRILLLLFRTYLKFATNMRKSIDKRQEVNVS